MREGRGVARGPAPRRAWVAAGAIALAAGLLCSAALANGFPFVYYDTESYAQLSFHPLRTPFYSIFVRVLHAGISIWPVVVAQALVTAHLLYLVLRVARGPVSLPGFLAIATALTVATSLPWLVGQIMADVFTPVVVLGVFLLGIGSYRMSRLETAWVFGLTATAISFHLSHLPLAVGLAAVALLHRGLTAPGTLQRPAAWLLPLGPPVLAGLALVAVSWAVFGLPTPRPGGRLFLAARSIEDGPGRAYLEERCPEAGFRLCDHLDRRPLTSSFVLWDPEGPVQRAGALAMREEAAAVFAGSLREHPGWHLRVAARHFLCQLLRFDTAVDFESYLDRERMTRVLEEHLPGAAERYATSRQSRGALPRETLRRVDRVAVALGLAGTLALGAVLLRRPADPLRGLVIVVLAGVAGNAFVCGVVSKPLDRYGSRVVWLLVFVALAGLPELRRRFRAASYDDPKSQA